MAFDKTFGNLLETRINSMCEFHKNKLSHMSENLYELIRNANSIMHGGKRIRSTMCYYGWKLFDKSHNPDDLDIVLHLACGFEALHAGVLVHDDILDNSTTRRGVLSTYLEFANIHSSNAWKGNSEEFGRKCAIILGDMLLAWSASEFSVAASKCPSLAKYIGCASEEVMIGQYLDLLNEYAYNSLKDTALNRAEAIVLNKTAKYTVAQPLVLGAIVAKPSEDDLKALWKAGVYIGSAFQYADDIKGVFGNKIDAGKSCNDIEEGKRTVLLEAAKESLSDKYLAEFNELLNIIKPNPEQVDRIKKLIRLSNAAIELKNKINTKLKTAFKILNSFENSDYAEKIKNLALEITSTNNI